METRIERGMAIDARARTGIAPEQIEMPASTAWPIVLAFGLTLVFAGMVTSSAVSFLGAILSVIGGIGWFRDVLPHEKHELLSAAEQVTGVSTSRPPVARVKWMTEELHRARLPLEIYPISAGVKGGLAGSVAMAVLAVLYGIIIGRGNLCAIHYVVAGVFADSDPVGPISAFHLGFLST